ncbi:MAG: hypothetical protein ACREF7_01365 [Candidatus Saccharimonadales bacterium]
MFRSRHFRFIVGVVLAIILIIVLLFVILFRPSGTPTQQIRPMASYASNPTAQVAMLIDGPINAVSEHNQVQVIITNSDTTINIFTGYDDTLVSSHSFAMSVAAFHVFLRALETANFNSGTNNPELSQASGYCPTGDRYIFTFDVNNRQLERYWSTSCGGIHTYNGDTGLTLTLIESQVPGYLNFSSNLNL